MSTLDDNVGGRSRYYEYANYPTASAIGKVIDNHFNRSAGIDGIFNCLFKSSESTYYMKAQVADNSEVAGIIQEWGNTNTYAFFRLRGADAVIKKLGSGTVSISNYIFNFNVSTSGNGSSSGNQGRSGKSEFVLNTEDYETLTIGSYKIEGDGAHAAWNPRDCVALSVTINGIKTTVSEGGHVFDVKSADTAIIIASFGTNGNPDYGTWATLTVSSIMLV